MRWSRDTAIVLYQLTISYDDRDLNAIPLVLAMLDLTYSRIPWTSHSLVGLFVHHLNKGLLQLGMLSAGHPLAPVKT